MVTIGSCSGLCSKQGGGGGSNFNSFNVHLIFTSSFCLLSPGDTMMSMRHMYTSLFICLSKETYTCIYIYMYMSLKYRAYTLVGEK